MKPGSAPLKSIRLLDQVRESVRYLQYGLSTEKVNLYWVKFCNYSAQCAAKADHPTNWG